MKNHAPYAAQQQIQTISQTYAASINQAASRLLAQLSSGGVMTWHGGGGASRSLVELREAKILLKQLRYPDADSPIRIDEMAWALQVMKEACETHGVVTSADAFDKAAAVLGVTLDKQPMPLDMHRKINNEMRMFGKVAASVPLAQAV